MSFEFFVAKRYALTKRTEQFITIISGLSALGIMTGVAALICVLSVFNGFSKVVTDILVNFDPHVRITAASDSSSDSSFIPDAASLSSIVKSVPSVIAAAPVVKQKAVIIHYTLPKVALINGIDEADADKVSGLAKTVKSGAMKLGSTGVVIGQLLADNLAAAVGDTIQLFSSRGMERIISEPVTPRSRMFIITGIFAANNRDYDGNNAYIGIDAARDLFEIPTSAATQIDIRLDDINESQAAKAAISEKLLGKGLQVDTWYDLHKDLYNVMEIERWIAYIILIMIVAVASFSIFSALTLTVFEKRRDIGVLVALGAESGRIRRIFLVQGLITGITGVLCGCLLGLAVVWGQKEFSFFKLDTSVYIIPALPVDLHALDFIVVAIGAMILVTIASIAPARKAAQVIPAESLRWE